VETGGILYWCLERFYDHNDMTPVPIGHRWIFEMALEPSDRRVMVVSFPFVNGDNPMTGPVHIVLDFWTVMPKVAVMVTRHNQGEKKHVRMFSSIFDDDSVISDCIVLRLKIITPYACEEEKRKTIYSRNPRK
jgi:hypothetical protein